MHASKSEWAMLCSHCRERYCTRKLPPALSWQSVATMRSCWRNIRAIATACTPCWPAFVEVGEKPLEQAVASRGDGGERYSGKKSALRDLSAMAVPAVADDRAFMADYADGEIVVDKKELLTADWYRYDDLPLPAAAGDSGAAAYEDTVAMCRAEFE